MGATTIEALLLKFACSVSIPLVMGYIDLLREVHLLYLHHTHHFPLLHFLFFIIADSANRRRLNLRSCTRPE
jgi:hypothetical protein